MSAPDYAAAACIIIFPILFGLCVIYFIGQKLHARKLAMSVAPDEIIYSQSVPLLKSGEPMQPVLPAPSYWDPRPRYSISSGELPAGLKLDSVTGAISGTPTVTFPKGHQVSADHLAFQVAVRAKNIKGACTTTLTIRVEPLTAPTGMSCPPALTKILSKLVVGVPITPWSPVLGSSGFPYPTFKISSPQQDAVVNVMEATLASLGSEGLGPRIISECTAQISSAWIVMKEALASASTASDSIRSTLANLGEFPNLTTCDLNQLDKQVQNLTDKQQHEASAQDYLQAANTKVSNCMFWILNLALFSSTTVLSRIMTVMP